MIICIVAVQDGATALYVASQDGYEALVKLLVEETADVNISKKV